MIVGERPPKGLQEREEARRRRRGCRGRPLGRSGSTWRRVESVAVVCRHFDPFLSNNAPRAMGR
ncbi:Hypothetical protein BN69_0439 [Methylocystis sp. SC2]|nr:Hypothetical protein BN69_0439 [Methylocystis sp. SC2]